MHCLLRLRPIKKQTVEQFEISFSLVFYSKYKKIVNSFLLVKVGNKILFNFSFSKSFFGANSDEN